MKIVMIVNNLPPKVDGVGDYTWHLAKELELNDYEVHIICSKNEVFAKKKFHNVYPIVSQWNRKGINLTIKKIQEIQPNFVSLQYVPYGYNKYGLPFTLVFLAKYLSKQKTRLITTFHEVHNRFSPQPKLAIIYFGQKIISYYLSKYSNSIVTSIEHYKNLLGKWGQKTTLIPVGSNIPPIQDIDKNYLNRIIKKIAPYQEFIISTFGVRDISRLLFVFRELKKEFKDIKLLVCGKTNYSHYNTSKGVIFTDYLEGPELFAHLKISNLFVIMDYVSPNGEGGTCNKSGALAAAYAAGLPIIGMKGDMNNSLLKNRNNILFTDYNDSEELKNSITSVIRNPSLRKELAANSFCFYNEHLRWDRICNQYQALLH